MYRDHLMDFVLALVAELRAGGVPDRIAEEGMPQILRLPRGLPGGGGPVRRQDWADRPEPGGRSMTAADRTGSPPTEEQARALGVDGSSVALSAGAGCGKTFVLAERFVRALEGPEAPAARPDRGPDVHQQGGPRASRADPQGMPGQARPTAATRAAGGRSSAGSRPPGSARSTRSAARSSAATRSRRGRPRLRRPRRADRPRDPRGSPRLLAPRTALRPRPRPDRAGRRVRPGDGPPVARRPPRQPIGRRPPGLGESAAPATSSTPGSRSGIGEVRPDDAGGLSRTIASPAST